MNTNDTVTTTSRRPARRLVALGAGALLLAVAGCGTGDDDDAQTASKADVISQDVPTLSKAEVIRQGGRICAEAEQMAEELRPRSAHPFADGTSREVRQEARAFLVGFADALEYTRDGLEDLDAPAQNHELLDAYVDDIGVVAQRLRTAAAAPAAQVEQRAGTAFSLFDRASEQSAAYGFPEDVCGA
jgi:hypothetical protein